MFLDNSRYARVATVETTTPSGEKALALKLRRLTPVSGEPHVVTSGERLDLIADAKYGDATQFWHVADANTALDQRELVETVGDVVMVPKT